MTQSQAKRINEIASLWLLRDQRGTESSLFALAAITLQSLNAAHHVRSCTLNAVRAFHVLETTFYDGFESDSPDGLKIKHYPGWRMVARVYLPTRPSVYATVHEPARHFRREQKVIESHAFVLRPPFIFVIPECPERPVRM